MAPYLQYLPSILHPTHHISLDFELKSKNYSKKIEKIPINHTCSDLYSGEVSLYFDQWFVIK
jgi:hypothetical protein